MAPDFTFPYAGFLEDHHQTTFIDLAQREWADALVWGATTAELAQRSDYRIMDVREMKFDDGIFDVIFCISVLEHIVCPTQDPDHPEIGRLFSSSAAVPALKEMRRCLKPGGKLVLTVDIYGGEKWKPYFDRWDVFRDIELAGFRMEIRQPFDREKAFQDAETFISRFHGPYITLGFSLEK
ncbi:MAG: class I SAM-dependent methyltransferase [Desulfobacter sp.]|nr:MAG: class I SAM-dependent methyltransferase [Desulfobacter sp.]